MRRRSIVAVLAASVAFATVGTPAIADAPSDAACPDAVPAAGFDDVERSSVHAAAIDCAASRGLVRGVSASTFAPDRPVTRAQVASLLARTLDDLHLALPGAAGAPSFADVGATAADDVGRLAAAGIVQGRPDGTFAPQTPVTRAQLATLLVRTASFVAGDALVPASRGHFRDVADGPHAANIDAAAELGLLLGRPDGTFAPGASTRRDQAASVAVRLLGASRPQVVGEVWSLDQGTDLIHVHGGDGYDELARIDVSPTALREAGFAAAPTGEVTVPHMIEFDSRERYAFVASTAGAVTIVIDARAKEVVEVLATGAGTHMAAVTPDDTAVWVAAIGAERLVEIPLDLDAEAPTFAIGRALEVADLLAPVEAEHGWEFPSASPVCHQFSPDSSEAWVTLGPGWDQGGFFVLDLASGTVTDAWDPQVVKANCGISVTETRAIANFSGRIGPGEDTNGEWYVFDARTKDLLDVRDSEGFDAHGLRLSPDGSTYWMVNRITDNALVIDADTLEVVRRYERIADTPDILDYRPDGSRLYVSQRGPSPRSGGVHAAAGQQPGIAVIDTATGETLTVLEPPRVEEAPSAEHPEGRVLNDVHGVAFRARGVAAPAGAAASPAAAAASDDVARTVPAGTSAPGGFDCRLPA